MHENNEEELYAVLEKIASDIKHLLAQDIRGTVRKPFKFNKLVSDTVEMLQSVKVGAEMQLTEAKDVTHATAPVHTPSNQDFEVLHGMLHREPVVTEYHPMRPQVAEIEPIFTDQVVVAAGYYARGSAQGNRDEAPLHTIYLPAFAIDIHPVTNEQFLRYLEFMGGEKDEHYNDLIRLKESRLVRSAGKLSIESGYAKHPVVGITWYGATGYARWVGKRLPTEAEWEVAAAGGLKSPLYSTGENIEKNQANFFSSDTTPVMSYPPNGYGLFDMTGNVYEWCQDWYAYNYYEASAQEPTNPKGPHQGVYRVLRGGCWKSLKEDLRISHRHRNNPNSVNGTCGFRCVSEK